MMKAKLKSINAQVLTIVLSIMVIMSASFLYLASWSIEGTLHKQIYERLSDNSKSSMNLIEKMYPGDWKLDGENLYKGSKLINNSTEIVDSINDTIGIPASIFAKDTRVSTNLTDNGNRILGTKAVIEVSTAVLSKGNEYIGSVKINGKSYETKYVPLKDSNKEIVGMFVVAEETDVIAVELKEHMSIIFIVIFIIIGIAIVVSTLLTRRIVKRIKKVVDAMIIMGQGDFTVRSNLKSGDEIQILGDEQNKMADNLSSLVSKTKKTCKELSVSSDTLAATSQETTATAEEISRALNDIADTTTSQAKEADNGLNKTMELSNNIQKISSSIDDIIVMFNNATVLNIKGLKIVGLLSKKNEESNNAGERVGTAVSEMDVSSQEISVIMNTISQIASQTNLLSLNASIEAARAGDAGRGFSVVASEIRKLAEQSATAASDISNIINGIQAQSKKAVSEMNITKGVIMDQFGAVEETKNIFGEISNTILNLKNEVEQIKEMNKEMISKKDTIVNVMEEIAASAQQNSAAVEQISASSQEQVSGMEEVSKTAEQLNFLAQNLELEIGKFKIQKE
jgi:methyl-accepting chemotaxis protein